jgi:hypothetical protein
MEYLRSEPGEDLLVSESAQISSTKALNEIPIFKPNIKPLEI